MAFEEGQKAAGTSNSLAAWAPERWTISSDWQPLVNRFFAGPQGRALADFVRQRLVAGATIYPGHPLRALELTPLSKVKVVIIGQDPYHGPGQAQGLAFSVSQGYRLPPSLRNIYKEISRDPELGPSDVDFPVDGSLHAWATQGVLLLNTCLTVEDGLPASHAQQGWEVLTRAVVQAVVATNKGVVFMLWGAHAQAMRPVIEASDTQSTHLVLVANHPSPLSALRPPQPFIGCRHFSLANSYLIQNNHSPVVWKGDSLNII
ncbi:uracil-DNA glycosylase [Rhodoferax sp. PAMC 29310]|uniref:uracil-DNA glycosylase n=1 Tax=Rhodoferax sp. PAMC 29310 TaxID=2822760 RepID=UPI00351D1355